MTNLHPLLFNRKLLATLFGAFCVTVATSAWALTREEYALEVPIRLADSKALASVDLPLEIYTASRKVGLADLRIVNGAGEAVPFALGTAPQAASSSSAKVVALLPFFGTANSTAAVGETVTLSKQGNGLSLTISPQGASKKAGQILRAYYADLRALGPSADAPPTVQSIDLNLPTGPDISTSVQVEASDDLKTWRTVVNVAPIFRLSRDGQAIGTSFIEFAPTPIRYLRLRSVSGAELLSMTDIKVQLRGQQKTNPLQWLVLNGTAASAPAGVKDAIAPKNTFVFDAGVPMPISRVNLTFTDANTLAPVRLLARREANRTWESLQSETFYRMNVDGGEARSPDAVLRGGSGSYRYWQVQIDERAGEFATKIPQLRLGFVPARVVFTARGSPPFALLIGNAQVESVALGMDSLVPGNQTDASLAPALANFDLAQAIRRAGTQEKIVDRSAEKRQQWILWGLLVLGVGGLAIFALRLLKEPKKI